MSKFLGHLFCFAMTVFVIIGCAAPSPVMQRDDFTAAAACQPTDFNASIDKGKLSWDCFIPNTGDKRVYYLGKFDVLTDKEVIAIVFDLTVEPKGQKVSDSVTVDGTKVVNKTGLLTKGGGCRTPTTDVPGNWPKRDFSVTYDKSQLATVAKGKEIKVVPGAEVIETKYEVMPILEIEYDPVEASIYKYKLSIKNTCQWEVVVDVIIIDENGDTKVEETIGTEAFKVSKVRDGKIAYDKKANHDFTAKIRKVTIMGKK